MTQPPPEQPLEHALKAALRDVPDFPEPGVVFKDFTPVFADPRLFRAVIDHLADHYRDRIEAVVGIEARGFVLAAALAYALGVPFVPIRKHGKLPGETVAASYDLEYGSATIEMHLDALAPGERVLVLDDVLATGGTARAACDLVERTGAQVVAFAVVLELEFLGGRKQLDGWRVHAVVRD